MINRTRFLAITVFILCCLLIVHLIPKALIPPYTFDDSILTGNPCRLPCWQGLLVGESNFEEVEQFLLQSNFVPNDLIKTSDSKISWNWGIYHNGTFNFDNDILTSMEVTPNFRFPLSEVFAFLGEPEAMRARGNSNNGSPNVELDLYYPQHGIVIRTYFDIDDMDRIAIPSNLQGMRFEVYQPSASLHSFVSMVHPRWKENIDQIIESEFFLGWPGFGTVFKAQPDATVWYDSLIFITPTPE